MIKSSCIAAALAATGVAASAHAAVTFTGTGFNPEGSAIVSGSAKFSVSGNTLTLVLTNTSLPRTTAQGNALTGVAFSFAGGSPSLTMTSIAMTGGSLLWTSKTASSAVASLTGSWTTTLGATPLGAYGAATTGFAGGFNGGSIALGNASPNYGIVAAGTFDGSNVSFGGAQFPFVQNSLTLTFTGVNGFNESQINSVKLLFGTDGTGVIQAIPSPGSLALVGLGGLVAARRRRN
ncbi:MAG: PEP-CTERM sorting domain-containing protein [Planctomycetes bacterium]|nr:PEP-CTERM sorting domain-containing protein [Planctomycetota bacterium]